MNVQAGPSQTVDVQALMREIRARIRGSEKDYAFIRRARQVVPSHLGSTVARLRASTVSLRGVIATIGELPPVPPTARGRIGVLFVQVMQRLVFWLIPSIRTSQNLLVDALEAHLKVTEEMLTALHETNVELARLRSEADGGETAGG